MTPTLPLILLTEPVPRGQLTPVKASRPSVAVVYATAGGELAWFDGRPLSWSQQFFSKYRTRFEVDVSDHRRTARLASWPLPSSDQVHRFEATVDVGFRVSDPVEVVRRNIPDALVVVYGHLADVLRRFARGFAIDEAARAEAWINQQTAPEMVLPEGITIYRCVVELHPDSAARGYVESLTKARRDLHLGTTQHTAAVAEARHLSTIADMELRAKLAREQAEQEAALAREAERRRVLGTAPFDIDRLISQHLVMHPEDTAKAVEMRSSWELAVAGRQELFDERSVEVFKFMVANDLIQPADVEVIRQQALHRVQGAAVPGGGSSALPPVHWGSPAVGAGPAPAALVQGPALPVPDQAAPAPDRIVPGQVQATVVTGNVAGPPRTTPVPGPAAPGPAQRPAGAGPAPGVLPVYVVVDESMAVAGCVDVLNSGLRSLHAALLTPPAVSDGIRLSVLGSAGEPVVHLPAAEVEWGTRLPPLTVRGGARHDLTFERLLTVIPADVERLKLRHESVRRPVLFVLLAGPAEDDRRWQDAVRVLTDPGTPYHPTVVWVGIGKADGGTVRPVAGRPELAFVAPSDTDLPQAAEQFGVLLQNAVLHLARGLASGRLDLLVECPPGLRRLADSG